MTAAISILPDSTAEQIAAGEVVERPASVVKELVENAIDADASNVLVEIEQGGRNLIRVSDDGIGMDRNDAVLCIERHATSKIKSASDLVGVQSYGFRGEALPAIASIAKFELETATEHNSEGTRVVVNGGRVDLVEPAVRQRGTTVTARRLFYNTPARRKFLRSKAAETRAVVEAINKLALAQPDISLKLVIDDRVSLDMSRADKLEERIAALFSRDMADNLLPVSYVEGPVSIKGFVQRPADARPSGRKAYLLVNGRPFRDSFIVRAAEAGYRGAIAPGDRPTLFLWLGVPGEQVDVNVHPSKHEVRFRDRFYVERCVEEAVRSAIKPMESAAVMGVAPGRAGTWTAYDSGFPRGPGSHESSAYAGILIPEDEVPHRVGYGVGVLLQVFNSFIVCEAEEGIAFIDQHSAHERIIYEQAMKCLEGESSEPQNLLLPITVDLTADELAVVDAHSESLARIGFEIEPFGGRSVLIHATPNPHPRFDAKRCFEELVADLGRERFGGLHNRLERFAATYGCRAAIKAGEKLEVMEMENLVRRLFMCELPPHDVHGRPTIVRLPRSELERRFGRT